jgi:capsule polysaccharide export protein KpsE/RkpR
VGTEAQYQEYQRLELEKQLADERLSAAQQYRNAATMWGEGWGPWPWF